MKAPHGPPAVINSQVAAFTYRIVARTPAPSPPHSPFPQRHAGGCATISKLQNNVQYQFSVVGAWWRGGCCGCGRCCESRQAAAGRCRLCQESAWLGAASTSAVAPCLPCAKTCQPSVRLSAHSPFWLASSPPALTSAHPQLAVGKGGREGEAASSIAIVGSGAGARQGCVGGARPSCVHWQLYSGTVGAVAGCCRAQQAVQWVVLHPCDCKPRPRAHTSQCRHPLAPSNTSRTPQQEWVVVQARAGLPCRGPL